MCKSITVFFCERPWLLAQTFERRSTSDGHNRSTSATTIAPLFLIDDASTWELCLYHWRNPTTHGTLKLGLAIGRQTEKPISTADEPIKEAVATYTQRGGKLRSQKKSQEKARSKSTATTKNHIGCPGRPVNGEAPRSLLFCCPQIKRSVAQKNFQGSFRKYIFVDVARTKEAMPFPSTA